MFIISEQNVKLETVWKTILDPPFSTTTSPMSEILTSRILELTTSASIDLTMRGSNMCWAKPPLFPGGACNRQNILQKSVLRGDKTFPSILEGRRLRKRSIKTIAIGRLGSREKRRNRGSRCDLRILDPSEG